MSKIKKYNRNEEETLYYDEVKLLYYTDIVFFSSKNDLIFLSALIWSLNAFLVPQNYYLKHIVCRLSKCLCRPTSETDLFLCAVYITRLAFLNSSSGIRNARIEASTQLVHHRIMCNLCVRINSSRCTLNLLELS